MKYIVLVLMLFFMGCCSGGNESPKDYSNEFREICIKGHIYFIRTTSYSGYLSPKLNDDGTPVKCYNSNHNHQ